MPLLRENLWLPKLALRVRTHWRLKCGGTIAIMLGFFVGYFLLLKFPIFAVTSMPVTVLDEWVEFRPGSLLLYFSLWLYVQLAPALLTDRRELVSFGWAVTALSLFSFAIFLFWPTTIASAEFNAMWTSGAAMAQLKKIDASGNACPSLHVAFAVFSALWNRRVLKDLGASSWIQVLNGCWCVGIVYSTLATKQHVFVDVLAGAVLGAAAALVHMQLLRHLIWRSQA